MLIFRMRHMVPNMKAVPQQISQAPTAQQQAQNVQAQTGQAPKRMETATKPIAQAVQSKPKVVPPVESRKPAVDFKEAKEVPLFIAPTVSSTVIEEAVEAAGGDMSQISSKHKGKSRSEEQSEEAATGLSCVWHPWRPAYAICNYCHRPFCFEDIVEQKGHYYCLEDIDKVGSADTLSEVSGRFNYMNVGTISGIAYVAIFLLFILFANSQLSSVISYSNSVGFFTFLSTAKLQELLLVLESIFALLAFVAGFLTLMHTKASAALGQAVGILSSIIFAYSFFAYGVLYAMVIAALALVALLMQIYSFIGLRDEETMEEKSSEEQPTEVQFANVGRF